MPIRAQREVQVQNRNANATTVERKAIGLETVGKRWWKGGPRS